MSSFNYLVQRIQILGEAKTSPYAAAHTSFGGVTKQMRAGGLSSAPLDTIKFIREILFNLDVISEEELQTVKSAKGFTGKKQAMLTVLRANQDSINAKADEITQAVEGSLDDFISGMGANRSREEKYAAQAAATEIAAEMRKARSGKELDDSLIDIVSDEKLLVKATLAKAIQELEDLPGGEDISPEVLKNIKEFAPKINNVAQFEAFVKQMGAMEEYQLPAYHLSGTIKALKGGLEDIGMEDQEDPDELDYDTSYSPHEIDPIEQSTRNNRDEDAEQAEGPPYIDTDKHGTYYYSDAAKTVLHREDGPAVEEVNGDKFWFVDGKRHREDGPAIEHAAGHKEWFINGKLHREDGPAVEDEKGYKRWFINGKRVNEDGSPHTDYYGDEDEEELTLEGVYDTMGFIKAPVIDENGIISSTCSTQQYLTEATERLFEESEKYTADYLTEQKEADSYTSAPKEKSVSFKERFKPKTQSQLEELRRYGL